MEPTAVAFDCDQYGALASGDCGIDRIYLGAGAETQMIMAGAVITTIPILILYFFTQKQFTEGISTTGLKG